MNPRKRIILGFGVVSLSAAIACGPVGSDDGGGGGGGSTNTPCGALAVVIGSAPKLVFAHPESDDYGVNSFYVWEVEQDATDPESYRFEDGSAVQSRVPSENWQIPATLWSAARLGLDGNDPYHFTAEEPFVLGYLPYTPAPSWQSKTGATNDGTCPGSNVVVGGLQSCINDMQLDAQAPVLLQDGHHYLAQMSMLIPLGEGQNYVQSCYREVFVY